MIIGYMDPRIMIYWGLYWGPLFWETTIFCKDYAGIIFPKPQTLKIKWRPALGVTFHP